MATGLMTGDGATTFTVSFAAFVTGGYCSNPPCAFLGDYMGIAAAPDAFHPVWCRSFDEPTSSAAQHQAAWSSSIPAPPLSTPTATASRTSSSPTATPTPTPFSISGRLTYYSNAAAVGGATVQLTGAVPGSTQSDSTGRFMLNSLRAGDWQIQPQKVADAGSGISALDASYILQAVVNLRTLSAEQSLACDVSGNGSISAYDASLILQYKVGLLATFPVADNCKSDWVFIPQPAFVDHQVQTQPLMSTGSCQKGAIAYQPLSGVATNQDFKAVLFGDCTGNWQPSSSFSGRGAAFGVLPATVRVGPMAQRHGRVRVPLYVQASNGFLTVDVDLQYDPTQLIARGVRRVGAARQALVATNTTQLGHVRIALAGATRLEAGAVLVIEFNAAEPRVHSDAVQLTSVAVGEN